MPTRSALHPNNLRFGPGVAADLDLPEALHGYARRLYADAWEAYAEAGCPLGETDEALLVWFTFQQAPEEPRLAPCAN